jgi:hypothetical protein
VGGRSLVLLINDHHATSLCYCRASPASPGSIRARRTHYITMQC